MKIYIYGESEIINLEQFSKIFKSAGFEITSEEESELILSFSKEYYNASKRVAYPEEFYIIYLKYGEKLDYVEENIGNVKFEKLKFNLSLEEALMFPFFKILYQNNLGQNNFKKRCYSKKYLTNLFFEKRNNRESDIFNDVENNFHPRDNLKNPNFKEKIALLNLYISDGLKREDIEKLERVYDQKNENLGVDSVETSFIYYNMFLDKGHEKLENSELLDSIINIFSIINNKDLFLKNIEKYSLDLTNPEYLEIIPKLMKENSGLMKVIDYYRKINIKKMRKKNLKNRRVSEYVTSEMFKMRKVMINVLRKRDYYDELSKKLKKDKKIREIMKKYHPNHCWYTCEEHEFQAYFNLKKFIRKMRKNTKMARQSI